MEGLRFTLAISFAFGWLGHVGVPETVSADLIRPVAYRTVRAGQPRGRYKSAKSRARAKEAIRLGDLRLARSLIKEGLSSSGRSERAAWRILESELEFASRKPVKAGLAAMRVVILHPESKQVGVALYWAGRAYAKMGRMQKAVELYEECLAHPTTGKALRKRAEQRLKKTRR